MADSSDAQEHTNQKLRLAGVHLAELRDHNPDPFGSDWERAHEESYLYHLAGVLDYIYQEINVAYDINIVESNVDIKNISDALRQRSLQSSAMAEIKRLKDDESSWLNQVLQLRHRGTHRAPVGTITGFQGGGIGRVWRELVIPAPSPPGSKAKSYKPDPNKTYRDQPTGKDVLTAFTEYMEHMRSLVLWCRNTYPQ